MCIRIHTLKYNSCIYNAEWPAGLTACQNCLYIHTYVHKIQICIRTHIHIYTYEYICIYTYIQRRMTRRACGISELPTHTYIYRYIHVHICICIYAAYIYIYNAEWPEGLAACQNCLNIHTYIKINNCIHVYMRISCTYTMQNDLESLQHVMITYT